MAVGKFQMLRQQVHWNSNRIAAGSTTSAVSSSSLSQIVACNHQHGCPSPLLQQRSSRRPCWRLQVQANRLRYTHSRHRQHQKNRPSRRKWCCDFGTARTQQHVPPQEQQFAHAPEPCAHETQQPTAFRTTGGLAQRCCTGTECRLGGYRASSLDNSSIWCISNSRHSSTRITSSISRTSRSNSIPCGRSRHRTNISSRSTRSRESTRGKRCTSNYRSINQNENYRLHNLFSYSFISKVSHLPESVPLSLSAPALTPHSPVHIMQQATRHICRCEAGFSSCGAAAAAKATAVSPPEIPIKELDERIADQKRDTGDEERRKRETAVLQLILPRRLRSAFPYVVPAFRPLVLLAGLPVEQQILSERGNVLRLAAARRGHALLPPFSPQTEELWCVYTQLMLTDPAVVLRQQRTAIRGRERNSERAMGATADTAARQCVFKEGHKDRFAASSFRTAFLETSTEHFRQTDPASEANRDIGTDAIHEGLGGKRAAEGGREESAQWGRKPRPVRISVLLGELLAQLLATRNVTLQAPWKLLLAAVEPSLQDLQQQQQQQKARQRGISHDSEATKTRTGTQSNGRTATVNNDSSEQSEGSRQFLEVVLRLWTAAVRVRHEWKWGVRQIEELARKDFPLFEKDRALRVLHALSSSKVDDRLCERLADAFVYLWRSDYAEATRLQPTEGLLLLDIFAQRKQLLQALPDPYFFKHICRRLHSYIHLGLLTPWEKTRLAMLYKKLKFPHFTFFSHIAAEVLHQQQKRQTLIAAGQATEGPTLPTADELQEQLQKARRRRLATLQQQLLRPPAVAGAPAGRGAATATAGRKAAEDRERGEPHIRAASTERESITTAALTAGEKEWRYLEYSRRDYTMGCGVPVDFKPSEVVLEQAILPLLAINTVKRLRRGELGCHLEKSNTSSGYSAGEGREDEEAVADDVETFERNDLPKYGEARTTTATSGAAAVPSLTGSSARGHDTIGPPPVEGIREYTAGQTAVIADAMLFVSLTRIDIRSKAVIGNCYSSRETIRRTCPEHAPLTTLELLIRGPAYHQYEQRRPVAALL